MSRLEEIIARSSCAACGASVHVNDDGRVACDTCDLVTEECTCAGGDKADMSLPV